MSSISFFCSHHVDQSRSGNKFTKRSSVIGWLYFEKPGHEPADTKDIEMFEDSEQYETYDIKSEEYYADGFGFHLLVDVASK